MRADEPVVIGLTQYQAQLIASARRAILAKFSNDGLTPTTLKALLADLEAAAKGEVFISSTDLLPELREPDEPREALGVDQAARVKGMSGRAVRQALQEGRVSPYGSAGKRLALANDPLNLLAVDAATNRSKGDGDTATWLPPNKAFRCTYVARQVAVKGKYAIWVTSAERDAMIRVLTTCPSMPLPGPGSASTVAAVPRAAQPAPAPAPPASIYYANCDAVRAAGAAPIHRGDPGYASKLDRDGDGIGCE